jgi:hypothetical protein
LGGAGERGGVCRSPLSRDARLLLELPRWRRIGADAVSARQEAYPPPRSPLARASSSVQTGSGAAVLPRQSADELAAERAALLRAAATRPRADRQLGDGVEGGQLGAAAVAPPLPDTSWLTGLLPSTAKAAAVAPPLPDTSWLTGLLPSTAKAAASAHGSAAHGGSAQPARGHGGLAGSAAATTLLPSSSLFA